MIGPAHGSGLFTSLCQLLATALEITQVRPALLSTEFELEKRRLFDGLLWNVAALLILGISLTLFCGFVILLLSDGYRLAAVGVLAAVSCRWRAVDAQGASTPAQSGWHV